MKIARRFLLKHRQGDLFPNRETVGIENGVLDSIIDKLIEAVKE